MVYDSLVKNSKFSQKILIATSILDNGVNIIDTELKNIVIFESNSTEMVQMAGRKRCLNGDFDTFNLYLKDETKKSLAGSIQKNEQFHQKLLRVKYEMLVKDDPNQVFLEMEENLMNIEDVYLKIHLHTILHLMSWERGKMNLNCMN